MQYNSFQDDFEVSDSVGSKKAKASNASISDELEGTTYKDSFIDDIEDETEPAEKPGICSSIVIQVVV